MLVVKEIRRRASSAGWREVQYNTNTRVIGFKRGDDRVNIYWNTGTMATCLDHPRQGKTQLFRKDLDLKQISTILKNPRAHTGVGYYRRQSSSRPEPSQQRPAEGLCACLATEELMDELIDDYDADRDGLVALGSGYFVVQQDGRPWWNDIPTGLHNKVKGRWNGCPDRAAVDYVALGPDDSYFVQFRDGSQQWLGPNSLSDHLYSKHTQVELLAFGPDDSWYVMFEDGSYWWEGIPVGLSNQINGRVGSMGSGDPAAIVEHLAIGPEGEWWVRYANGDWRAHSLPEWMDDKVDELNREGHEIVRMVFGHGGTWLIQYAY